MTWQLNPDNNPLNELFTAIYFKFVRSDPDVLPIILVLDSTPRWYEPIGLESAVSCSIHTFILTKLSGNNATDKNQQLPVIC